MTIAGLPDDIRARCRESNVISKSTLLEVARQFNDAAMHEFLDGLTSGKIIPRSKQKATNGPVKKHTHHSHPRPLGGFTFKFDGKDPEFSLELHFAGKSNGNRAEILKALKTAFEAVKNNTAEV